MMLTQTDNWLVQLDRTQAEPMVLVPTPIELREEALRAAGHSHKQQQVQGAITGV